jgi:hypothetical protein
MKNETEIKYEIAILIGSDNNLSEAYIKKEYDHVFEWQTANDFVMGVREGVNKGKYISNTDYPKLPFVIIIKQIKNKIIIQGESLSH